MRRRAESGPLRRANGSILQVHHALLFRRYAKSEETNFEVEDKVYQLGLPPRRIDILTSISGVSFDEAAQDAIEGHLGQVKVRFIGKVAMARNKLATGRPKDLADAELLQSGG